MANILRIAKRGGGEGIIARFFFTSLHVRRKQNTEYQVGRNMVNLDKMEN